MSDEELLGGRAADPSLAACLRAGLLLRADAWEAAHQVAQDVPGPTGSYWHAILHRREPDHDNARYWFRRVGDHPVYAQLRRRAEEIAAGARPPGVIARLLGGKAWDPFAHVALCEEAMDSDPGELLAALERIGEAEVDLLLAHCFRGAVAPPGGPGPIKGR